MSELDQDIRSPELDAAMEVGLAMLREPVKSRARAMDHYQIGQFLALGLNRPDEAIPHLYRARKLFEALENPWLAADAMSVEAAALYVKGDPQALALAAEALRRYQRLVPRLAGTETKMLRQMGGILAKGRAFASAHAYYQEAIQVAGTLHDWAQMSRIYHGLSMCYEHFGKLSEATEFAQRALALYSAEQDQPLIARGENELGLALMRQGQLDRAEQYIVAAIDRLKAADVAWTRSHYVLSLGELRVRQGLLDDALHSVTEAIELASRLGETLALISGHQQLGDLHARRRDHTLANASLREALRLARDASLPERRAEVLAAYARVREARA